MCQTAEISAFVSVNGIYVISSVHRLNTSFAVIKVQFQISHF